MQKKLHELHILVQNITRIKKALIEPLPHHGESALFLQNDRLTTGVMNNTTEIAFSLLNYKLMIQHKSHVTYISAQKSDFEKKANKALAEFDLPTLSNDLIPITNKYVEHYLAFAHKAQRSLAFFRSNLEGEITPVYLWGHGFDFSVEWHDKNSSAYIIVGIAPYDESDDNAYAYVTPQPFDSYFTKTDLPIGNWYSNGWNGIKIPWTELEKLPMSIISDHLLSLYTLLQKKLCERARQFDFSSKSSHCPSS